MSPSIRPTARSALLALAFALALDAGAAHAQTAPPPAKVMVATSAHGLGETKCAACHTTSTWKNVQFDHAQTGFLLKGAHQKAGCFGCHAQNLSQPVPLACAGCHQDAHRGEFGQRCAGCHQEENWKTTFNADAHRRTGFPLTGRHAFISCEECHGNKRDRSFTRAGTKACAACHTAPGPSAGGWPVNHAAYQFTQPCRDCHTPTSFKAARFPEHDACFQLSGGPHGGISCLGCHKNPNGSPLPDAPRLGTCATTTAACTKCHAHDEGPTNAIHAQLAAKYPYLAGSYKYADLKCWQCHAFSGFFSTARAPRVGLPGRQ